MNVSGNPPNWGPYVPPYDSQYSASGHTDAVDCVAESLCHIVYMMTGFWASPRALANLSKTTTLGNTVLNVLQAANNNGIIAYDLWPTPASFTWDDYYAPIPYSVLSQGINLGIQLIPPDLTKSPLWTQLQFGVASPGVIPEEHMVAVINSTQYFDSESGAPIKPISISNSVIYETSILITKPMNQSKIVVSKTSQTVYICYPVPSEDYLTQTANLQGIVLPNPIPNSDTL